MELNDLYTSPNFTELVKSKSVRLVGHATGIGGRKMHTGLGASRNETAWNTLAPRWKGNIKTHLKKKKRWIGVDWFQLVEFSNKRKHIYGEVNNFSKNVETNSTFQAPEV